VSILSERRSFQPYGLHGGAPGSRGINLITFAPRQLDKASEAGAMSEGKVVSLGGKNTIHVNRFDRLTILTPGGGGYGEPSALTRPQHSEIDKNDVPMTSGSLYSYQLSQESA
jgi:5-oxoprolinase (ATP-hydrolysing)